MTRIMTLSLLLSVSILPAGAQETECRIFRVANQATPNEIRSSIRTRQTPFPSSLTSIPRAGESLENILFSAEGISKDLVSMALSWNRVTQQPSMMPLFYSSSTPDAIVFIRGNVTTIFPRFMLLHPLVRKATVRNGDVLATYFLADQELNATSDGFLAWHNKMQEQKPSTAFEVPIGGPLATSPITNLKLIDSSSANLSAFFTPGMLAIFGVSPEPETLLGNSDQLDQLIPVYVLERKIAFRTLRYIIPYSTKGVFREHGQLYQKIVDRGSPPTFTSGPFRGFSNLPLLPGDRIILTPLQRVPPFNEITP